jgi:soluble cytochrome b562
MATFDLMLGGREQAEEEFQALEDLARGSAMTKQQVMEEYRTLFSFTDRFGSKASEDVIAAGADIQKALGTNAQSAFISVMRNIEALGGLNVRTVRQLREVGIATPQRLYEALAKDLHTTTEGAKGLLKAHKISQDQSINTLLELVQGSIDKGGALGEFSLERSKENLDDQIKNFKESFKSMFEGLDTAPAAHAIAEFGKAFDPATESGQHLRAVVQEGFNDITKAIDYSREHLGQWISFADRALHVAEALLKVPKFIFDVGFKGGEAVASLATGDAFTSRTAKNDMKAAEDKAAIDRMNAQIDALSAATASKVESNTILESAMHKSGIDAGSGFVEGLARSLEAGKVPDVIHQYVTNEVDRALDAHSPSRVMMKRGHWAGEGLGIGFRDEMRQNKDFGFGFGGFGGGSFGMPTGGGAAGLGGGSLKVDVSGTIKLEGSGVGDPQHLAAIGGQFEEIANRAIQRAFESLGHQN